MFLTNIARFKISQDSQMPVVKISMISMRLKMCTFFVIFWMINFCVLWGKFKVKNCQNLNFQTEIWFVNFTFQPLYLDEDLDFLDKKISTKIVKN